MALAIRPDFGFLPNATRRLILLKMRFPGSAFTSLAAISTAEVLFPSTSTRI